MYLREGLQPKFTTKIKLENFLELRVVLFRFGVYLWALFLALYPNSDIRNIRNGLKIKENTL